MRLRRIALLLLLIVLGAACAGFNYRYYGLSAEHYEGQLLASEAAMDRPFEDCRPQAGKKVKCFVFFRDEIERLLAKYAEMENRLATCEKNHP